MNTIGVGVIGCGEIAQLMHLPILHELPDVRIAAVCDISPGTMTKVAEHYGVPGRYTDFRALLQDSAVEAVIICTYDHAEVVSAAIDAGKHVIVEKPLAFTPEEARPLVAAAEAAGVVAMVGYMKRYDPGYEAGLALLPQVGLPRAIHVHNLAGRFDRYGALYDQFRVADAPADVLAATRAAVDTRIESALGPTHRGHRELYFTILMLGSHNLAVMRGAFGAPERVAYARRVAPMQLLAVLEFPGGVPCTLEICFGTAYEWWDEWIAVYGQDRELRIDFPNPYLRYSAAGVRLREPVDGTASERLVGVPQETSFRREWRHFIDLVRNGGTPRTPLSEGLADLELAVDIIRALPPL